MLASWLAAVLVKRTWNDCRLAGTDRPDSDSRWVSSEPVPISDLDTRELGLRDRRERRARDGAEEAGPGRQEADECAQHPAINEKRVVRLLEKICDSNGGQKCEQREEQAAEPEPDVAVGSHGPESTLIGANSVPRYRSWNA